MLVLIGFEYTKWFGNLILFGLVVLLIFIAISIVSKIRELSTERAIKRAKQEKYTKENLKGIKTNLELENKLSAFSGKANMVQINSSFIHESFEAANLALSSAPEQSTKILTKLSKHLRNIVQFDFPPTQELKIELKVLLDFIDVANSHSENKIIFQENHSADLFHEVPSRLLVSFANVLFSNLKATSEKFSLLLSIEEQKEELIVKALPQFEKSNFKPRMRLSSLNSFLFIQRIKVAEIKTSEAQIHLSIFLNHTK